MYIELEPRWRLTGDVTGGCFMTGDFDNHSGSGVYVFRLAHGNSEEAQVQGQGPGAQAGSGEDFGYGAVQAGQGGCQTRGGTFLPQAQCQPLPEAASVRP